MAYFLKKSNLKKGTAHRPYKALGYIDDLQAKGISDPIEFYKEEVAELNKKLSEERQRNSVKQISEETPEKLLGYFPLKSINEAVSSKMCKFF